MKKQSLLQFEIKKENSKKQIIVQDHPSPVIENPSLSNVDLPDAWFNSNLPVETVNSGALSALQLETIIYSCQRHEQKLADGSRAGFLIGDGAGVGKGRMAAGIIFENFIRGRKKAIWFSVSTDLKYDAERDLRDIGADQITVYALNQLKNSSAPLDAIESIKEGVLFSTYSDLIAELSITSKKKMPCLEQLLKWCGQDFDGVVVFDECHHINNINYSGSTNTRKIQLAFLELQNKLPNARIIYISTNAISELRNIASMIRLGLWGQDTPFEDFSQFLETVKKFGEIAEEMVETDMKQRGLYVNRQLSFTDVTYEIAEVCLLPKCITSYNSSVKLWVELRQSFTEAVKLADLGPKTQQIMWANFWSAHRKFFRCLCISAKVAHAVKIASEAVKRGKCVVIGLQSTGEAYTLQKIPKDGRYKRITNFVSTSKVIMQSLVEKCFPASDSLQLLSDARNSREGTIGGKRKCVRKTNETPKKTKSELSNDISHSEIIDSRDGCAPLFDYNSDSFDFELEDEELVEDRKTKLAKASLIKQRLLEKIEELGAILPPNWFDQLIDEFGGPDNVAEISTRKGRVVQKSNGLIQYESRSETEVSLEFINIRERERFMNGEKNIAIVSAAASGGISLQADRRVKNQRHRVYISLELPNSVEFALQQFGCTHRSNQVRAPEFIFLVSKFAGDRRFALILSNRLQCLGATYKNERLNEGPFKFNLDEIKKYDCAVLYTTNIFSGKKPPIVPVPVDFQDIRSALVEVGLTSDPSNLLFPTKVEADVPEILNRILGISAELQATLLQYVIDVQSTICNRVKTDSYNDMKILDLGIDKCVCRTKLLRFTSKNPMAPIPVKIELHEFEVDGGMSWRAAEEKWLPKSNRQADEGFYLSKEMCHGKRDIILVRRIQTVGDRADKGSLKYTVIRPSMGMQPLPQTLAQITQIYTPQNSLRKLANIEDMRLLWNFHYNASKNDCIHAYWRKSISKKKHPKDCQEGLRLYSKYKLLSGPVYLVWKKIESLFKEHKQWKAQFARVQVESISMVGVVIPDYCVTELSNFITALYSNDNYISP